MAQPVPVHVESWDVRRRLAELGLEESILLSAAERGFVAWASCTANHPPSIPGLWAWAETVCGLGEQLIPRGWDRRNESNWPFVVNRENTVVLTVATGDEQTGRNADIDPVTTSAKGPRTFDAVATNKKQLQFAEILPPREALKVSGSGTWLLLVHRDIQAREMRCELSRPISMDNEGHVNGWAERILLTARPFDGIREFTLGGENGIQSPEIKVEIRRRAR
jgi:hypothetical protein